MQPSPSLATTYHVSEEYDSSDEDDSDEVLVWEEHESSDEDGTQGPLRNGRKSGDVQGDKSCVHEPCSHIFVSSRRSWHRRGVPGCSCSALRLLCAILSRVESVARTLS